MKRIVFVAALCVAAFSSLFAQVSSSGSSLSGIVADSEGARVAAANVVITNSETGALRRVQTATDGAFSAPELAPGVYEVEVSHEGFATAKQRGVVLLLGRAQQIEIHLKPAAVASDVTVSGDAASLDVTQSATETNFETEQIAELPVESRSYLRFALLAPGVAQSQTSAGAQSSAASLADSGFSFGGLRGRSNSITIDGAENNDEFTGANRTELSLELVREFQVVNTGISAESGGASGGAINVVTKSGANILHGDAFLFVQNAAINAREPFADVDVDPQGNKLRGGLAVGGPLRRNRTFCYLAGEQEHARERQSSDIDAATRAAINEAVAGHSLAAPLLSAAPLRVARAETELAGKLDYRVSENENLMLRYGFTNNREAGDAFNATRIADPSARGSVFTEDHSGVAALASVLSPTTINEARFQAADRRVALRTLHSGSAGFDIAAIAVFGPTLAGNGVRRERHLQYSDALSLSRGTHLVKLGATANRISIHAEMNDAFAGRYTFASIDNFAAAQPQTWVQAFGNPRTSFSSTMAGFFVQDHWAPRALPRVALDLGVRYDVQTLPVAATDKNNVSPRVGVTFRASSRWVARASYGIYFDREVLAAINRVVEFGGTRAFLQVAQGTLAADVFNATDGARLATPVPSISRSIFTAEPHLNTPFSQQASAALEYQVLKGTTANATYQYVRGTNLSRTVNMNLAPPVMLTAANAAPLGFDSPTAQQLGRPVFGPARLNSAWDNIYQLQNRASSNYHGVSLSVKQRIASDTAFVAGYTWSKASDNASDFDEEPQNPYDLRAERGPSLNDQRHRFTFSGVFELFGDDEDRKSGDSSRESFWSEALSNFEFAPIAWWASGAAQNATVGFDANHGGALPSSARPFGYSRNALRTPAQFNVDLRVVKYFNVGPHGKLDFVAEVFNAFNRTNVSALNTAYGAGASPQSAFGTPLTTLRPRQLQFSIDYEF